MKKAKPVPIMVLLATPSRQRANNRNRGKLHARLVIYEQDLCSDDECLKHRHCKRWKKYKSGKWRDRRVIRTCMGYVAFRPLDEDKNN